MCENSCKDLLVGIKFVQFQKNLSYHSGIKRTPYKAMFGVEAKVGLTSSSLPDEIISKISTEERLLAQHFPGFVGVSVSHERLCTLVINPLIEI
jgi:hypothetical protein